MVNDKLVEKVNNIDTSRFVLKTKYNTDKTELGNKIPDTSKLVKKTDWNAKITEIENKLTALTAVENKITSTSIDYWSLSWQI